MKITWHVDDGYRGKSRPHSLAIDDGALAECETEEEKIWYIEGCIEAVFMQTVSFYWKKEP